MRTLNYQPFKLLFIVKPAIKTFFGKTILNGWQKLRQVFYTSLELQVYRVVDEKGKFSWSAYNPKNGESVNGFSEEQMRIWIEEHYYLS